MPTRYLNTGVRDSENINSLSDEAECLFYRLLVTVDDFGRFDARPSMIKANCFPVKAKSEADCIRLLIELESKKILKIYTVEGKSYLILNKWKNIPRSKKSKYPDPPIFTLENEKKDEKNLHMYTSVCSLHTNVPETVTVTETVTETKKTKSKLFKKNEICELNENDSLDDSLVDDKTLIDQGLSKDLVKAWRIVRKNRKQQVLTLRAWKTIKNEAHSAGLTITEAIKTCCDKNWASFRAQWIENDKKNTQNLNKKTPGDEIFSF